MKQTLGINTPTDIIIIVDDVIIDSVMSSLHGVFEIYWRQISYDLSHDFVVAFVVRDNIIRN